MAMTEASAPAAQDPDPRELAVVRVQAIQRGRSVRIVVGGMRAEAKMQSEAAADAVAAEAEAEAVATRLGPVIAQREIEERERQEAVERTWVQAKEAPWQSTDGPIEGGLRVFSSREDADKWNDLMLKALPGKHHGFNSTDSGDQAVLAESAAPPKLGLRLGARVLCLKDVSSRLRHGAVGHVGKFEYRKNAADQITDVGIVVEFSGEGRPFTYAFATALSLENTFSEENGATRVQIPLRLAYATSRWRQQAEERSRLRLRQLAEEDARAEAEEREQAAAEQRAQEEARAKARAEAEEKSRLRFEAEEKVRREAEEEEVQIKATFVPSQAGGRRPTIDHRLQVASDGEEVERRETLVPPAPKEEEPKAEGKPSAEPKPLAAFDDDEFADDSDDYAGGEGDGEEDYFDSLDAEATAALRVQRVQRGRSARAVVGGMRAELRAVAEAEEAAAEKVRRAAAAKAEAAAEEERKAVGAMVAQLVSAAAEAGVTTAMADMERAAAEAEAKAKREAAEAKAKAEREAAEAEAEVRREAEEAAEAARRAVVEEARRAEEEVRREADEKAMIAELSAAVTSSAVGAAAEALHAEHVRTQQEAEAKVRAAAEAAEAAERAVREAEEKARRETEEAARKEAEEMARLEAEAKAKLDAEERARREAEMRVIESVAKSVAARVVPEAVARAVKVEERKRAEEKAKLDAEVERLAKQAEEEAEEWAEEKRRRAAEQKRRREAAATHVQRVTRGAGTRRQQRAKAARHEQAGAAAVTRVAAVQRGRCERRAVEAERAAAQQRRAAAAVVLQRTARGKRGRRAVAASAQTQQQQRRHAAAAEAHARAADVLRSSLLLLALERHGLDASDARQMGAALTLQRAVRARREAALETTLARRRLRERRRHMRAYLRAYRRAHSPRRRPPAPSAHSAARGALPAWKISERAILPNSLAAGFAAPPPTPMTASPRQRRPAAAKGGNGGRGGKGGGAYASQFVRRPFSAGPAVTAPVTGFIRSLNEQPSWRRGPLTPAPRAARAARTIQQAFLEAQARQRRAPRSLASSLRLAELAAAVAETTLPAVGGQHGRDALNTAASARRTMETAQHQRTTLLRHMQQTPSPVPAPVLVRPEYGDPRMAAAPYSARPSSERGALRPAPAPPGGGVDDRPPTAPSPRATAAYQAAPRAAQAPHSPRHARPTAAPRRAWHAMSAETPRPPSQPRAPPPAPPPPFALTADEALTMGLPGTVGYSRPGSQLSTRPQSRGVRMARPLEQHEPPSSLHSAY